MSSLPYLELQPGEMLHRRLIHVAIKVNDQQALAELKGRINKPIHFVTNWFYYELMKQGHQPADVAVIRSLKTRMDYDKFQCGLKGLKPQPDPVIIPLDTYDFLL